MSPLIESILIYFMPK